MCLPLAIRQFHMGEDCAERRIFRTAGVDTELNLTFGFMQVADAHLVEPYAIRGTFYAKISCRRLSRYHMDFTWAEISVVAQSDQP